MKHRIFFLLIFIVVVGCEGGRDSAILIAPLQEFALQYEPCIEEQECDSIFGLPILSEDLYQILNTRKVDEQLITYNTLILLKLYRTQLERTHQSYDIRNGEMGIKHPVLTVFTKYSGVKLTGDFVSSSISFKWAKENSTLLNNPLIQSEVSRIETELDKIERQVYWK